VAGELDDRWLRDEESGLKPGTTRARREESPDTALRQQGMGNAPGNARGAMIGSRRKVIAVAAHGKCHRKQTAARASFCDGRQGNLLIVFQKRYCW